MPNEQAELLPLAVIDAMTVSLWAYIKFYLAELSVFAVLRFVANSEYTEGRLG